MPRLRPRPSAPISRTLPANVIELQAQAIVQPKTRLIDAVDLVYKDLIENPAFRALRGAEDPVKTVHGSVVADDVVSAQMIKERGMQMRQPLIAQANLHEISMKLRGAERRYQASRKQRSKVAPTQPMQDDTDEALAAQA